MWRVAAVQLVSGSSLERNLQCATNAVEQAAAQGAELVVLPESFALFAGGDAQALAASELESGQLRGFMSALAQRYRLILIGGTVPMLAADGRLWACSYVYDQSGAEIGCYRKVHLFDAEVGDAQHRYRESELYAPGSEVLVVETTLGRLGVAVCYDLRFPEQFRLMQQQGMDILAVPAAFTRKTGWSHWLPLLRARAIENQCLVVGANQGGIHSDTRYCSGASVIVDCWGEVQAELALGEGVAFAVLDPARQVQLRQEMPVSQHRVF